MEEQVSAIPVTEPKKKKEGDDFVLSGMFFTFGLLLVVGGLVYLLTIQTNANKCEPVFDEKGVITNNCPPENPNTTPVEPGSGQIELLEDLKPKQNKIPEIDGR